jgi:hypothetical protein
MAQIYEPSHGNEIMKVVKGSLMRKIIPTIVGLLLLMTGALAQSTPKFGDDVESLRGLKGIRVLVQYHRADALEEEKRPVILQILQSDAEEKFKKAGIPLLKYALDEVQAPGSPTFVVLVTMDKPNGHVYPVVTKSKLFQTVVLPRSPDVRFKNVSTWENYGIGNYELTNMEMLRLQVGGQVDMFIKDYLTVNPRDETPPNK